MGNNALYTVSNANTIFAGDINQFSTAMNGDIFPRTSSGTVTANSGNLGSATFPFSRGYFSGIAGGNIGVSGNTIVSSSGALNLTPISGQNVNITVALAGRFAVNTSQFYVAPSLGFVGVGTASPVSKLNVVGDFVLGNDSTGDQGTYTIRGGNMIGTGAGTFDGVALVVSGGAANLNAGSGGSGGGHLTLSGGNATKIADSNGVAGDVIIAGGTVTTGGFGGSLNPGKITFSTAGSERVRIVGSTGGVGIGTTAPDALLSVNGVASFGAGTALLPSIAAFGDLDTGAWFPAADTFAVSTGGVERVRVTSSGNVGIGIAAPQTLFDVSSAIPVARLTNTTAWSGGVGSIGAFQFYTTDSSTPGGARVLSEIECYNDSGSSVPSGVLIFKTALGGASGAVAAERMRIDSAGKTSITGTFTISAQERCKATFSANIALVTATDTAVAFNAESLDVGGFHDNVTNNSRFTVPVSGFYQINAQVTFAGTSATGLRRIVLRQSGTTQLAQDTDLVVTTAANCVLTINWCGDLTAAQYVEIMAYQNSGGNLNINLGAGISEMTIVKMF